MHPSHAYVGSFSHEIKCVENGSGVPTGSTVRSTFMCSVPVHELHFAVSDLHPPPSTNPFPSIWSVQAEFDTLVQEIPFCFVIFLFKR